MPDLSSVFFGSLSRAAGLTSHSLVRIMVIYSLTEGAYVPRVAAAACADDGCSGFEERHQTLRHVIRQFVVDDFHIDQLGLPGVGLYHHREFDRLPVPFHGLARTIH